jgi:hypothetical protein
MTWRETAWMDFYWNQCEAPAFGAGLRTSAGAATL